MRKKYKYLIIHLSEQVVMFGIRLHVYWILCEDIFSSILLIFTGILRVCYEYFGPKGADSYNRVLG